MDDCYICYQALRKKHWNTPGGFTNIKKNGDRLDFQSILKVLQNRENSIVTADFFLGFHNDGKLLFSSCLRITAMEIWLQSKSTRPNVIGETMDAAQTPILASGLLLNGGDCKTHMLPLGIHGY